MYLSPLLEYACLLGPDYYPPASRPTFHLCRSLDAPLLQAWRATMNLVAPEAGRLGSRPDGLHGFAL